MAKQAVKNTNIAVNSVQLEPYLEDFALNVKQETIKVDAFSDAGPRTLVGNYDYDVSLGGNADFAAALSDATLFGLIGSAGVAVGVDPTGAASPGAGDPHYDSTSMVLESYSISGAIGGAVKFKAALKGNSALARTVA